MTRARWHSEYAGTHGVGVTRGCREGTERAGLWESKSCGARVRDTECPTRCIQHPGAGVGGAGRLRWLWEPLDRKETG